MSSLPPDGETADHERDAARLADELATQAGDGLVADQDLQDDAADLASDAEATGVSAAELIAEDVIAESVEEALEEVTEIAEELAGAVVEGELTEDQAEEALEVVVEELRDEIAETIEEADAFVEAELETEDGAGAKAVLSEDELLDEAVARPISPYDRPGRWYVVHTQSGYEKKVKQNLEARIGSMNMEERIHEVVIPMEDVVEFKNGKKVVVQKKVFPGYLLVRCELDEDSWYVIRNTPGVTGFVGQGAKPSPLPRRDVESFLQVKIEGDEGGPKKSKPRLEYEMGETVRVKEGPFAEFNGEIIEINEDQLKVKVLLNLLGRETPVELEFSQVAKL
jgi:transcription termination/antitermination protein NusG